MGGFAGSRVTFLIGRGRWRSCWQLLPKRVRALRMFRTIGILRRGMWHWWPRSVFWKRGILRTLARFTRHCTRPGLISVPDDTNALQIRVADHRLHPDLQRSLRRRPVLLRTSQCGIAAGIYFRDSGDSAAEAGDDLLQSPLASAQREVDSGVQIAQA